MKAETLTVCILLVWRVCDHEAFGRYRSLKGAEKWSRNHHENSKFAYSTRRTIHWFQNAILFDQERKITKLSRKTVSELWRHQLALVNAWQSWIDARHQYMCYLFDQLVANLEFKVFLQNWPNYTLIVMATWRFDGINEKLSYRWQIARRIVQMQWRGWPAKNTPLPMCVTMPNLRTGEPHGRGAMELLLGWRCGWHQDTHCSPHVLSRQIW